MWSDVSRMPAEEEHIVSTLFQCLVLRYNTRRSATSRFAFEKDSIFSFTVVDYTIRWHKPTLDVMSCFGCDAPWLMPRVLHKA
jgi:hypothetical protein